MFENAVHTFSREIYFLFLFAKFSFIQKLFSHHNKFLISKIPTSVLPSSLKKKTQNYFPFTNYDDRKA